jgi:hypothetical protein
MTEGPPARKAGAPPKIHPMSYVAVYLDIEERKATKDGKARRRALSLSAACDELAGVLNTVTANHYAGKSLQAMYRHGRELLKNDIIPTPAFINVVLSGGREVKIPFISTEITSDGLVRGPMIDGLERGGND